ncbi:HAD family phosphatase [Paenibacillus mesophilus]|uniref:Cof-type HAD-IIB family hydrolase n=1 Tax=Paenibacillus mesophilus TaxID=2582849 RepID=UPI00110E75CD|nr:Cof-type HAD-IIB family hydrolase [Paenibacillus mesophilus]TMV43892.1 HAD family phosphatase [Paenibacillus mesophilus]
MTAYKVLALDMDGTLLTDSKQITEETRRWLQLAEEAGVTVMFATGRGMQTAGSFWEELGLNSPMVLLNGAEIWEGPGRLYERAYISRDDIRRLYGLAVEAGASFWGYSVESLTSSKHWNEDMFDRDWMKFGIRHDDLEVMRKLREEVRSWGHLEVTRSADINMEISVRGISKASGIKKVCELLGITIDQVMAVGDHHNDMEMLRSAGLGIAMGNADEEVKRAADGVTDTNERDGVAKAIQKYLLQVL